MVPDEWDISPVSEELIFHWKRQSQHNEHKTSQNRISNRPEGWTYELSDTQSQRGKIILWGEQGKVCRRGNIWSEPTRISRDLLAGYEQNTRRSWQMDIQVKVQFGDSLSPRVPKVKSVSGEWRPRMACRGAFPLFFPRRCWLKLLSRGSNTRARGKRRGNYRKEGARKQN